MPGWLTWLAIGLLIWVLVSIPFTLYLGRVFRSAARVEDAGAATPAEAVVHVDAHSASAGPAAARRQSRILIVDDDAALRMLLRTTLAVDEFEVAEAENAERASQLARFWRPTIVLLDVAMPGMDGLSFCGELKRKPAFGRPIVILLTGTDLAAGEATRAGADAVLQKPFSPLELVGVIDRMSGVQRLEPKSEPLGAPDEQLLLYARDLGRLVEIERMQRRVVQDAYRETVTALASALEAKDADTSRHSLRVRDYALQLTAAVEPDLLRDPSLEYGFVLHDVGKIGVPNDVLTKPGPLSTDEFALVQQHTLIGAEMLAAVTFLHGEGLRVIRSHHERWDGTGYPDRLAGEAIPLSARIFAVADAIDAMTGERPYREPLTWEAATREITVESGRQFDPEVVEAFMAENDSLRRLFNVTGKAA
ncbi:MAG TPA: HD domain-containing phosphohydrolase [Gaiellaceae bacterium]|nr:HD domain-containing phosphohydrolase [Gaiellaceae bacterium]